jgi:hypothetical protein
MPELIVDLEYSNRKLQTKVKIINMLYKALIVSFICLIGQSTGGILANCNSFIINCFHLAFFTIGIGSLIFQLLWDIKQIQINKILKKYYLENIFLFIIGIIFLAFPIWLLIRTYDRFKNPYKFEEYIWPATSIFSLILNMILKKILAYDESNFSSVSEFDEFKGIQNVI